MKPSFLTIPILFALLLAGAFFLPDQPRPVQASPGLSEYANLLAFYRDTGGRTHWRPECRREWQNERAELRPGESAADYPSSVLTLSGGQAVAIRLRDCGLTGRIPAALTQLTGLRILDLSDNDLSGPIPPEIENLGKLTTLDFSGNKLNGEIPGQLGHIPNLERLRLNNNRLHGELPIQLGNLIQLVELNVTRNHLTGVVPPTFRNLFTIEAIYLQNSRGGNEFYGCINIEPKNSDAGVPYCQNGNIPTPVPTRVPFPTPTYTPVPTYTPRPTFTPVPTWTPVPTHTPIPTATPVVNPEVNLTAARKEFQAGEPIKLTLTLVSHPRSWRALNLRLRAPDGLIFGKNQYCTPNLCEYGDDFDPGEPPRIVEIEAMTGELGALTITGDAQWFDDENPDGNPSFTQPLEVTFTVSPKEPLVDLHATKTKVAVGESVVLTLTAQNFNARQPMTLNLSLPVPDGWSKQQSEIALACSGGQCFYTRTLQRESSPTYIGITVVPNEPGEVDVNARIDWYFGDNLYPDHKDVPLKLTVGPALPTPSPVPTPPPATVTSEPNDDPESPATATPPVTVVATASPSAATAPAATPTAAPEVVVTTPVGSGGGSCNAAPAGNTAGGDVAWLGLALLGLIGWAGRRRKS